MQGKKKIGDYIINLNEKIGEGATGKVYLCYHQSNAQASFAVKIVDKNKFDKDEYLKIALKREFMVHRKLRHQNIVRLVDMTQTKNNIYIVQQYCEAQTLQWIINKKKRFSEAQAVLYIKQVCMGFTQLVKKGVIHRDLKPQNIFISAETLKIGDFGFAKDILTQKQLLTSIVGSPIYMAPQILKGQKYTSKCDVWSLGIIFFQLLYGRFPWVCEGRNMTAVNLIRKVLTEPLLFPDQQKVSGQIKDFIETCLQSDEAHRLSWLQVFQSPIFGGQFDQVAHEFRRNYQVSAKLLNQLAYRLKVEELIGAFLQFKQFQTILKWLIPEASQFQLGIMYEMFDKDGNGVIDLYEFVKAFQVCDDEIILLLHNLVQNQLTYEELKDRHIFEQESKKYEKSEKVRSVSYKIIDNIVLSC